MLEGMFNWIPPWARYALTFGGGVLSVLGPDFVSDSPWIVAWGIFGAVVLMAGALSVCWILHMETRRRAGKNRTDVIASHLAVLIAFSALVFGASYVIKQKQFYIDYVYVEAVGPTGVFNLAPVFSLYMHNPNTHAMEQIKFGAFPDNYLR